MRRAILPVAFLLCVLLIVGCGGDGGTNPQPEPPRGFTAEYRRGAYVGDNMCRLNDEGTGYEKIYDYELWLDWWTDDTTGVQSVEFSWPFRLSEWSMVCFCLKDSVRYSGGWQGDKEDGHWKRYLQGLGDIYVDWTGRYHGVELCAEVGDSEDQPPFYALVSWNDGADSLCECGPRQR